MNPFDTPPAPHQSALTLSGYFTNPMTTLQADDISLPAVAGHFDPAAPAIHQQATSIPATLDIDGPAAKIGRALERAGLADLQPETVLLVGEAVANDAFALLHRFPGARVVSCHANPDVVASMAERAAERGVSERLSVLVANAALLEPVSGTFDLLVSTAILYHLTEPFQQLDRMLAGLRPGGLAVLYEPFQAGNLILRQCLGEIVRRAPYHGDLPAEVVDFIGVCVLGLDLMFEEPRTHPALPNLEDKWMFTRAQFAETARRLRLPPPVITSTNATERTWELRLTELIRSGMGRNDVLPEWVGDVLKSADANVSPALREEMLMEGEILFRART